jgi:DNA topoisomerase-2
MSASDYDMLSLHEQIMLRPDTYVGSYDTHRESRWIWDAATGRMVWKQVQVNPALLKIFDEVLVNSLDHRVRMIQKKSEAPMKHLEVSITPTKITVRNDGEGIPVEEHPVHKIYAPEMIFGKLLSSSNYKDDKQERIVGGMNGYGAKLANIFSTEFTVETVDATRQKRYKQVWKRNMLECGKASITKATCKPFTEISFTPDLARFKWEEASAPTEIPADMLDIMRTRVIDAAACAGKECKVVLNGVTVASNTFPKYVELYLGAGASGASAAGDDDGASVATGTTTSTGGAKRAKSIAYDVAGERWEIAAILTSDLHGDVAHDERHISFVNGINTRRGGKHVEYVSKMVMTAFCEMAKKKAKLAEITPGLLKDSVVWFINSTIVNPAFDTQTKECLTTPSAKFGSLPALPPKFVDKLAKIGLLEEAQILMDAKNHRDVKKTDGKKKSSVRGIPKLEDATLAGTAKSAECTLILTEGDSAATTAISGLKVVGRDRYGVFPLKGKILNVKDASVAKKTANQELVAIKQILGLEHGKTYTDLGQLRYGRVMIMTDQDVDGSHIKGLLMNLFHTEWPSLLHLGFLCCLMTPLLKATKGSQVLCFYSESEYRAWQESKTDAEMRGWRTKYYKGLGTSTAAEAREYFANMNTVEFAWDASSDTCLDLAFNKKRADDRKDWLRNKYDRSRNLGVKAGGAKVSYSRFVNDELIHFSIADNIRSIPSVMDGLKPSQRKILWSALKRNLVSEIKVAQLAGYVSETAAYHHGEASLMGAIVGMAQNFVGSNNVNLLAPNGQFGSRLAGGSDSASPRYIFTALEPIVRALIHKEDDAILAYTDDDGQLVEPEHYQPVVPLLLLNGAIGIGTGFSTTVLPYNPVDVIAALRGRLVGATDSVELAATKMAPWWFGFRGAVSGEGASWTTKGLYEFVDDDAALIRIRELPVGTWTHDYKEFLDKMRADQEEALKTWQSASKKKDGAVAVGEKPQVWLRDYKNDSNDVDVSFLLEMDPDAYHEARAYPKEFEARFKLSSSFKTTNMVAFNAEGRIHKYESVGEILAEFYRVRLAAYGRRKEHELKRMAAEIRELDARLTFVRAVVERKLVVANAEDADLLAGLKGLGVPPLSAPDAADDLRAYDYLLRMRVDRLKAAAVAELEREVAAAKAAFAALEATSIETLWIRDLDRFEEAWVAYREKRAAAYEDAVATSAAAGGAKKPAVRKVVRKVAVKK